MGSHWHSWRIWLNISTRQRWDLMITCSIRCRFAITTANRLRVSLFLVKVYYSRTSNSFTEIKIVFHRPVFTTWTKSGSRDHRKSAVSTVSQRPTNTVTFFVVYMLHMSGIVETRDGDDSLRHPAEAQTLSVLIVLGPPVQRNDY